VWQHVRRPGTVRSSDVAVAWFRAGNAAEEFAATMSHLLEMDRLDMKGAPRPFIFGAKVILWHDCASDEAAARGKVICR